MFGLGNTCANFFGPEYFLIDYQKVNFPESQKKSSTDVELAVRTGLEPATPCVTGTYSNQLNYRTSISYWECKSNSFYLISKRFSFFFENKFSKNLTMQ